MKRREFITLLGGGAVAWPLAARAAGRTPRRIGVLLPGSSDDPEFQVRIGAFLQGLALLGWSIDRNARIETRWATSQADEIRRYAAELAALAPDVILAHGASTIGPLLQATRIIPVVFPIVSDPVAAGFVESLARPGGNAAGFMVSEYGIAANSRRQFGAGSILGRSSDSPPAKLREAVGAAADAAELRTRDDIRLHMRTPPMGMSGVQVLGTGGYLGGVAEGRHNSIRCIRHSKRGRPPAAPSHPVSPRQLPIHNHYSVI